MAVSFTPREKTGIIEALRLAAGKRAATVGMRKTTVDELALEAGISKGAFYKFYASKELLFLDVLEQWYEKIHTSAMQALAQSEHLPTGKRAAMVLKAAWRIARAQPLIRFCQEELPFLLRKLPQELLHEPYRSVDEFIRSMLERSRVALTVSPEEACAVVKMLFFSLMYADEVGGSFEQAMDGLVDGACGLMIQPENAGSV